MIRNRIIGLTGGIGAGKSVVSRILRLKGFPVYDCDSEAKRLMGESEYIKRELCGKFGDECLLSDGTINRQHLSGCVFGNKESLEWLNGLIHAEVRLDFLDWAERKGGVCFVESAILRTSHLDEICDEIWLVDAPEDIRVDRAMTRGGISRDDLLRRINAQREEFDGLENNKVKIIRNYGNYSLLERISVLIEEIKN